MSPPTAADPVVAAATGIEAVAAWTRLPRTGPGHARVRRAGIGARRWTPPPPGTAVLGVGVCGGLDPGLRRGDLVVPRAVGAGPDRLVECDRELHAALVAAARSLGCEPATAPLLTSAAVVRGAERLRAASLGFAAVDMESALLAAASPRFATVRAVLDTAEDELPDAFGGPRGPVARALAGTRLVALAGPVWRTARLSAAVAAEALRRIAV